MRVLFSLSGYGFVAFFLFTVFDYKISNANEDYNRQKAINGGLSMVLAD
jgi:hypothetical protein